MTDVLIAAGGVAASLAILPLADWWDRTNHDRTESPERRYDAQGGWRDNP